MALAPRILALVASRVFYGQERANLLVLETMKAEGYQILAVVEDHPSFQIMPEQLTRRGIPFEAAPMIGRRHPGYLWDFLFGTPVRLLSGMRKLKQIINEFQPTHIHVANPFAFLMAWVSAPANLLIIYRIGDEPAAHNAIWSWIWRQIVRRVDLFVADSDFIRRQVEKLGVPRARIRVIYSAPPRRTLPPRPNHAPENLQNILFIGQITQIKGVDLLISAFRTVAREFSAARLTIVGRVSEWSGDDWARDLKHASEMDPMLQGRVSFVGETEDIYDSLACCGFLAVPSVCEEAFGIVVVEAKAAARPAVIFPRGGLPEQIRSGVDGYICEDTSVEALAEGLRYYLSDLNRTRNHGEAALRSLKRMRIEEFAKRWRDVYERTNLPDPD